MHENERPLLHWNTPLQNLVLDRQRELERDLMSLLERLSAEEKALRHWGDAADQAISAGQEADPEVTLSGIEDLERRLQVYDRLAARPWERVKGWFSLAALIISIAALALRFVGHAG